ncbi:PaeR7I family type II restriction endonuclease [Micromonospora sp. NIE79]|uniref:PaeR7I family type II restriction endonuclease n=1 Tax=Micromonospora trifolii TaxID=2911208 RepID=A0ABS9N890_9ACTN|nr:PaeR7I family type II restriction endonuclease [Micromonospora trifolii]MCG5446182.1 PaeR7I family type II restriction endonuclease [Micromonospora trifolii]
MVNHQLLQTAFAESCRSYWTTRDKQSITGKGEGLAAAVRAGKHFGSVQALVESVFIDCGYGERNFLRDRSATVPGHYRVTKNWDLIVHQGDTLIAALELKSLGANSAANNFNNRTEEAIGNATDLRLAHAQTGMYGDLSPWAGFMFLIEESAETIYPVGGLSSKWPVDAEFRNSSYLKRGEILSRRMLQQGLYDAVCFVTSSQNPAQPPREPVEELSWLNFVEAVLARVREVQSHLSPPGPSTPYGSGRTLF